MRPHFENLLNNLPVAIENGTVLSVDEIATVELNFDIVVPVVDDCEYEGSADVS